MTTTKPKGDLPEQASNLPELNELPELVTTTRAAAVFSVTTYTIRLWLKNGTLKGRKINGYHRIYRPSIIALANEKHGS